MALGEKLKQARKAAGLTQAELAGAVGITTRSLQFYEQGKREPNSSAVYVKLAQTLGVSTSYLISQNELVLAQEREEFLEVAGEKFGSRGKAQAKLIIDQATALFAGGELEDTDKEMFMKALMDIYFDAKGKTKKYTNREA